MKCKFIQIHFKPDTASVASQSLVKRGLLKVHEASAFEGPVFQEGVNGTRDLHIVYRDGMACVNYIDETLNNERVNYDYSLAGIGRVKRY